jgi:hypothetical protein
VGQGVTDWGAAQLVAALFGLGPAIGGFWVGLLSDEAGEDMDGTMVTDLEPPPLVADPDDDSATLATNYARRHISLGPDAWAMDSETVTNTIEIPFPMAGADWGPVDHWALLDASTEGGLYCWSALPDPAYLSAGWQLVVPEGALVIALTSLDDEYNED